MSSTTQNLVGKRIYRMSSHAPNRGTVAPGGYLKREMKKRGVSNIGGDGMSDTRSGLAAAALKRQVGSGGRPVPGSGATPPWQQALGGKGGKGGPKPFGGPNDGRPNTGKGAGTPFGGPGDGRPLAGKGGMPFGGPNDGRPLGAPAGPQAVNINRNGRLDLPFDFQMSAGAIEKQRQANEALFQLQTEGQQQAQEYLKNLRGMGQQYEQQQVSTLNDNAGRGTAFSSGYGHQVGQNANVYNQGVSDLETQNMLFRQQQEQQRSNIQTGLLDYLRSQTAEYGHNLNSKAGSLGFGKSPTKPKPKPKPKPKKRK